MKQFLHKIKQEIKYYQAIAKHKETPKVSKWLLCGAILYLVSPIDLIPDCIPFFGQLDDLLIIPVLVLTALVFIPESVKNDCREVRNN